MGLSGEQIAHLLQFVAADMEDNVTCDDCFAHISEYAEKHLAGKSLDEAMLLIENHVKTCPCCQMEFEVLVEALKSLGHLPA